MSSMKTGVGHAKFALGNLSVVIAICASQFVLAGDAGGTVLGVHITLAGLNRPVTGSIPALMLIVPLRCAQAT